MGELLRPRDERDRRVAAACYLAPIPLSWLLLRLEGRRRGLSLRLTPYQRHHARQSLRLAAMVALFALAPWAVVLGWFFWFGGWGLVCIAPLWLIHVLYAYHAYVGQPLTVPLVTRRLRGRRG